jgi:hypothetical protein
MQARKRHHLSRAQVQTARELGMNLAKLGSIDNHRGEMWKTPLPDYIERLYFKRFGHRQPEAVVTLEEPSQTASAAESHAEGREGRAPLQCRRRDQHLMTAGTYRPGAPARASAAA